MLNFRLSQTVQVIMRTSPAFWWTGLVVSNLPASIFRPLATFLLLWSSQHCNFPCQTSDGAGKGGRWMWITSIPVRGARTKVTLAQISLNTILVCSTSACIYLFLSAPCSHTIMLHNDHTHKRKFSPPLNFFTLWSVIIWTQMKCRITCHGSTEEAYNIKAVQHQCGLQKLLQINIIKVVIALACTP